MMEMLAPKGWTLGSWITSTTMGCQCFLGILSAQFWNINSVFTRNIYHSGSHHWA